MRYLSRMRKFLILYVSLLLAIPVFAQDDEDLPARPVPAHLVNDLGNVFAADQEMMLEQKLLAYNDSTSTQITVVTIASVQPYEIGDYAYKLGRKWGVGQADKDNGIVILVAVSDHKVFIATGYGIEGYLPDIATSHIINDNFLPAFRQNDYYGGINTGLDEMYKYLTGAYEGNPYGSGSPSDIPWGTVIIIVIVILFIISSRNKRNGGTTFTGGGRRTWGYGGGYFGGGGFGGGFGGFGGGGFGGFGGGGFGGGGAGGSW